MVGPSGSNFLMLAEVVGVLVCNCLWNNGRGSPAHSRLHVTPINWTGMLPPSATAAMRQGLLDASRCRRRTKCDSGNREDGRRARAYGATGLTGYGRLSQQDQGCTSTAWCNRCEVGTM